MTPRPLLDRKTGGGRKVRVWWTEFYVAGRRFRRSTGTGDRRAAELLAGEMMKCEERRAAGIETFSETRAEGLAALVEEYETELQRRGRDNGHVERTTMRVRALLDGLPALAKATPEELRRRLAKVGERVAARTVNYYRTALHGFFGWLRREGRWLSNPIDAVPPVKVVEKTRERRALTATELARLLAASPPDRAAVYLLAATTGLRRGELKTLEWARVDLDGATVTVRASLSKSRREAVLPLRHEAVEALRALRARQSADGCGKVFDRVPTILRFRGDLEAAGIPYGSEAGFADSTA